MVIPWAGLPLARLLDRVEPMGERSTSRSRPCSTPARMPGQKGSVLDWPYVEGLRLDEAMHPLTILAAGLYGRELPAQNGAPLRLVVPWKYGFKGIKSIVKITLVSDQPPTTWNISAPIEYGFYLERQPGRPPPALEPGDRAADRRIRPPADAPVQRLRRAGRPPLRGHGPAGQLLSRHGTRMDGALEESIGSPRPSSCSTASCPSPSSAGTPGHGRLGANPVNFAIRTTGILALHLPRAVAGRHAREPDHRLGLARPVPADARACTLSSTPHCTFSSSSGSTAAASVGDTVSEILMRPYLMVGMVGLVLMVPLAATSTNGMIKRLGPARWKALHRLAYVAAAAGALHFYMLVKADISRPIAFAAVLGLLFLVPPGRPLPAAADGRPEVPDRPAGRRRPARVEVLGRTAAGRPGVRRDARGPHVPPGVARRAPPAVRLPPRPVPEPDARRSTARRSAGRTRSRRRRPGSATAS